MSAPGTIPDLVYVTEDGSPKTRLQMEQHMRETWPKVHWLRIRANKIYGLPKQAAFDMKEAQLRHWVLDEMVNRGQIVGDAVGVNALNYNDEDENRQFSQRLAALIQAGQALLPNEGEGVDMSNFQPPGPPMPPGPPNGQSVQQSFTPPSPPGAVATPPMPPGFGPGNPQPPGPPQAQPAPAQPPGPPGPPQQFQPAQPPGPPAGPPPGPPQGAPPGPPSSPPQQASGGGRRRGKAAQQPAQTQQAAPVPPIGGQAAPGVPMPPGQQAGVPMPPGGAPFQPAGQPPQPQQAHGGGGGDVGALTQKLDELMKVVAQQNQTIATLSRDVNLAKMALTTVGRAMYQRQGSADLEEFLKELGYQVP